MNYTVGELYGLKFVAEKHVWQQIGCLKSTAANI